MQRGTRILGDDVVAVGIEIGDRGGASCSKGPETMTDLSEAAVTLALAIQAGDLAMLRQVLADHTGLASAQLGGRFKTRTALHVATDWPGYFPNGPQVVRILIEAGADPNGRSPGDETPLHWAA